MLYVYHVVCYATGTAVKQKAALLQGLRNTLVEGGFQGHEQVNFTRGVKPSLTDALRNEDSLGPWIGYLQDKSSSNAARSKGGVKGVTAIRRHVKCLKALDGNQLSGWENIRHVTGANSYAVALLVCNSQPQTYTDMVGKASDMKHLCDALPPMELELDCVGRFREFRNTISLEIGEIKYSQNSWQWQHGVDQLVLRLQVISHVFGLVSDSLPRHFGRVGSQVIFDKVGYLAVPKRVSDRVEESVKAKMAILGDTTDISIQVFSL